MFIKCLYICHVIITKKYKIMTSKFYKTPVHYFKVYSENYCICVADMIDNYEIGIKHASLPLRVDAIESTREEFEKVYSKVLIKLNEIYESNN